jgi:2'-5' RNA ligase
MNIVKRRTIIVTLLIDEISQAFFDTQRKKYFPAYANFTTAHLTLFHCLPNKEFFFESINSHVSSLQSFNLKVTGIMHNKTFNGYKIEADTLLNFHQKLQHSFKPFLSQKDTMPLHPHITVQNKTTTYKALKTKQLLEANFVPFEVTAIGISCWLFSKNNWEHKCDYLFK